MPLSLTCKKSGITLMGFDGGRENGSPKVKSVPSLFHIFDLKEIQSNRYFEMNHQINCCINFIAQIGCPVYQFCNGMNLHRCIYTFINRT